MLHTARLLEALDRALIGRLRARGCSIALARRAEYLASYPARRREATRAAHRLRDDVVARDGSACGICGGVVAEDELSIDHIIPVAVGGTDGLDNLRVAHRFCNSRKGARHA